MTVSSMRRTGVLSSLGRTGEHLNRRMVVTVTYACRHALQQAASIRADAVIKQPKATTAQPTQSSAIVTMRRNVEARQIVDTIIVGRRYRAPYCRKNRTVEIHLAEAAANRQHTLTTSSQRGKAEAMRDATCRASALDATAQRHY